MSVTSATTAADVMDLSAVLMNDPTKTDYTYVVLLPFLKMALDELVTSNADSQIGPAILTSAFINLPEGKNNLYPMNNIGEPKYPIDLLEVQEVLYRHSESSGNAIPLKRVEMLHPVLLDELTYWAFEDEVIKFNGRKSYDERWIVIRYIKHFSPSIYLNSGTLDPTVAVGSLNSRSYLAYKTAALAAMFIGENPERAGILEAQALKALEQLESISNKGRQQIMTRHRPFRAAWKMRGGW
jgi:hypothetical protein